MIRIATNQAKKSTFHRTRVGAVITKGGRIFSTGFNELRYYRKLPTKKPWDNSLHAEGKAVMRLLRTGRQTDLINASIYISRVKKDGTPGLAKPCKFCEELIRAVGIRKVFYTTDEGSVECMII